MNTAVKPPSAQDLQGIWTLVRWEITYDDGRPTTYPFGPDATGLIQYTHDGGMAACSAPEAERLAAFESFFQYAGRYEVRQHEGRAQVVHHVSHALNPNFVGSDQIRNMDFAADGTLTLSASDPVPGTTTLRHHRLIWRR